MTELSIAPRPNAHPDRCGDHLCQLAIGRYRYEPIPDDREALRRIVDEADVINAHGRVWLLIAVPPPLLDYLCAFDAATEDDEDTHDAEQGWGT